MKDKSTAKKITAKDGVDVYYWQTHKPEMNKTPIVIHPGAGMNHSSLEVFENGLNERGHPTVLIEPRGCGYSKTPLESEYFTLDNFSQDLQKIIEQEGLEKPSVFAHSFGGMISFDYVARTQNARDITGACVSHNFNHTTVPYLGSWIFGNIVPLIDSSVSLLTGAIHSLKLEKRPYRDQSDLEGKTILSFLPAINDIPIKQALSHFLTNRCLSTWDATEQLGKIKAPIHLIHGYTDFMVMPYAAGMIKRRAGGEVTSDKLWGSHTLPYANPQAVLKVMDKYLQ